MSFLQQATSNYAQLISKNEMIFQGSKKQHGSKKGAIIWGTWKMHEILKELYIFDDGIDF